MELSRSPGPLLDRAYGFGSPAMSSRGRAVTGIRGLSVVKTVAEMEIRRWAGVWERSVNPSRKLPAIEARGARTSELASLFAIPSRLKPVGTPRFESWTCHRIGDCAPDLHVRVGG
jgi:hypothetical protein